MRIRISFDGASTDAVRACMAALAEAGVTANPLEDGRGPGNPGMLEVGCDGPEKWKGITPAMRPHQFAMVAARLIKVDGQPVADVLNALRAVQ